MLVIRLRRIGRAHDPHYRIVVTEHTAPPQGKFMAELGHHHPKSHQTTINADELNSWLAKGAKPSNTVAKLCQKVGITHKHIIVKQYHGQPKPKIEDKQAKTTAPEAQNAEPTIEAMPSDAPTETTEKATSQEDSQPVEESSVSGPA